MSKPVVKQICRPTSYNAESAELTVTLPSGRTATFSCYGPEVRYGGTTPVPPKVNWPSIGSSSLDDAAAFAAGLTAAVELAAGLRGALEAR